MYKGASREKGRGKEPLPKAKDGGFLRRQAEAKRQELRSVVYTSAKAAGVRLGKRYRTVVGSSESEDEYLDQAVGAMMADDQCAESSRQTDSSVVTE